MQSKMSKNHFRVLFVFIIISTSLFIFSANFGSASEDPYSQFQNQAEVPAEDRTSFAQPREGITVATSHRKGDIVALNPNGTLLYHNDTYDGYWDIDPIHKGSTTVVYSASNEIHNKSVCVPVDNQDYCLQQIIESANLTTGETTVLYSRIDPRYDNSEWHDIDRINESHYIVADMYSDEVFIINVNTGITTWEWNLQNYLSLTTGGSYPKDWAHINDVEVLEDDRIMVSLRNQDQVIFINKETGVINNWTLGSDDQHSILYEQHNPDYIPQSNGGPAVIIADSENNRIIEYQRTQTDEWNQTWVWQDGQLQWPRDADRLPNGHTLITDTQGDRVIQINQQGEIVWEFEFPEAYEAEYLDTGDESTDGPSATKENIKSRIYAESISAESDSSDQFTYWIKELLPNKVVNGIANGTPVWVGFFDIAALLITVLTGVSWIGFEIWLSNFEFQKPITRK